MQKSAKSAAPLLPATLHVNLHPLPLCSFTLGSSRTWQLDENLGLRRLLLLSAIAVKTKALQPPLLLSFFLSMIIEKVLSNLTQRRRKWTQWTLWQCLCRMKLNLLVCPTTLVQITKYKLRKQNYKAAGNDSKHVSEFNKSWLQNYPWLFYDDSKGGAMFFKVDTEYDKRPFERFIWNT